MSFLKFAPRIALMVSGVAATYYVAYFANQFTKKREVYFKDRSALYGKPIENRIEPSW